MAIFKGAGVAIVTPMKDNQDVNYDKLEELINQQIDAGTDAIVIAGTTGESSTLTMEEHRDVIKAVYKTPCSGCCWNRFELHTHSNPAVTGSRRGRCRRITDRNAILQQGNTGRTD